MRIDWHDAYRIIRLVLRTEAIIHVKKLEADTMALTKLVVITIIYLSTEGTYSKVETVDGQELTVRLMDTYDTVSG